MRLAKRAPKAQWVPPDAGETAVWRAGSVRRDAKVHPATAAPWDLWVLRAQSDRRENAVRLDEMATRAKLAPVVIKAQWVLPEPRVPVENLVHQVCLVPPDWTVALVPMEPPARTVHRVSQV